MSTNYPEYRKELVGYIKDLHAEIPKTMRGFSQLSSNAVAEGTLSTKTKELIAVALAVGCRCEGCIAFHVRGAMQAGNSRAEIMDALGVAILMGGGPSMVYACEAVKAIDQFAEEADS